MGDLRERGREDGTEKREKGGGNKTKFKPIKSIVMAINEITSAP